MDDTSGRTKDHGTPPGEKQEPLAAETREEESPKKRRRLLVEELKKDLEDQKQLAQNNYEKFLRAYAELENFKKRVERERADNLRYANEELMRDLLPFIDNLERAVQHATPETNDATALTKGIELTLRELLRVLEKHGLKPIEAAGSPFDPNLHEAMMQVETEDHEPQTVVGEFQKGYLLRDRLLRPAKVSVAVRPASQGEETTREA